MKLFNDKFVERHYFPHQKLFRSTWLQTEEPMTSEEYQSEMLKLCDILMEARPTYLLTDSINLNFEFTEEMKTWTINEIIPIFISAGIKKQAILVPTERSRLNTIPESISNIVKDKIEFRFFSDIEEAKKWFFQIVHTCLV